MSLTKPPAALVSLIIVVALAAACGGDAASDPTSSADGEPAEAVEADDAIDATPRTPEADDATPPNPEADDTSTDNTTTDDTAAADETAEPDEDSDPSDQAERADEAAGTVPTDQEPTDVVGTLGSNYLGAYELADDEFGTMTTVTVAAGVRTIATNALPDHETGMFPNDGNPNTITAQDLTWEYPAVPVLGAGATAVRTTGVAVNGIKFEPGTGETVTCESGESYRIEGLQSTYDLGMDINNAHVQPTGEYHYHGVSELLVEAYASDDDLVHVGFAADGFLIYYSKADAYASGWELVADARTGTDCLVSGPAGTTLDLDGTSPDGTYTSDWTFTGGGALDECNGTIVEGEYVYILTDTFPYVPRCLMGEVAGEAGPPPGGGAPPGGGTAPADAPEAGDA